ncbi:hypothetical protein Vafri_176, partial [Volvox africanus]
LSPPSASQSVQLEMGLSASVATNGPHQKGQQSQSRCAGLVEDRILHAQAATTQRVMVTVLAGVALRQPLLRNERISPSNCGTSHAFHARSRSPLGSKLSM